MVSPFTSPWWRPVVHGEQWQIIGVYFVCQAKTNNVMLSVDHDTFQWIEPKDFHSYPLIENLVPVFAAFLEHRKS